MTPSNRDVIRAGAELVRSTGDHWLTPREIVSGVVVFVHGFTSHGIYMKPLAEWIEGFGWTATIFNYDSQLGIDTAALELKARLELFSDQLSDHGFVIVAHSMGGLVARYLVHILDKPLQGALRGIALLGTPNQGAVTNNSELFLSLMLDWADRLTGPNPYARSVACRSAAQLTLQDSGRLIERLNEQDRQTAPSLRFLSVSGGLRHLEFGSKKSGRFSNFFKNKMLQGLISENANDGLVVESSANICRAIGTGGGRFVHRSDYSDYHRINHTYLTQNQAIAGLIASWIKDEVRLMPASA